MPRPTSLELGVIIIQQESTLLGVDLIRIFYAHSLLELKRN
jgi:hypothetical protein